MSPPITDNVVDDSLNSTPSALFTDKSADINLRLVPTSLLCANETPISLIPASGGHASVASGVINSIASIDTGNATPSMPMNYNCGSNVGELASSIRGQNNSELGASSVQTKHNSGSGFLELSDADWRKVTEDTSDKSIKVNIGHEINSTHGGCS